MKLIPAKRSRANELIAELMSFDSNVDGFPVPFSNLNPPFGIVDASGFVNADTVAATEPLSTADDSALTPSSTVSTCSIGLSVFLAIESTTAAFSSLPLPVRI